MSGKEGLVKQVLDKGDLAAEEIREDNFNLRKWGEEYRRYVEAVPAINLVKGLRKLRSEASR